jgi:hypothetical protein
VASLRDSGFEQQRRQNGLEKEERRAAILEVDPATGQTRVFVAEGVLWFDHFGHQVWPLRGDSRIHVLTIIRASRKTRPPLTEARTDGWPAANIFPTGPSI